MWPILVGSLFFVGKAIEKKLLKLGIMAIGELARLNLRQLALSGSTGYEKLRGRDRAADLIRGRYGIDSVKRAFFLYSPVDYMSGGNIPRKKNC